jgi:hypothetical protein
MERRYSFFFVYLFHYGSKKCDGKSLKLAAVQHKK